MHDDAYGLDGSPLVGEVLLLLLLLLGGLVWGWWWWGSCGRRADRRCGDAACRDRPLRSGEAEEMPRRGDGVRFDTVDEDTEDGEREWRGL